MPRNSRRAQLHHRVQQLLRQIYGSRSEKVDPAQLLLFIEQAVHEAQETPDEGPEEIETQPVRKKKGHGRKKPPAELPHFPYEYDVPESEKTCAECGCQKNRMARRSPSKWSMCRLGLCD